MDRAWGAPVPGPDAPISGMQSGDLPVLKADALPTVDVRHHMAAQDQAERDAEPFRPLEQGLGALGLSGVGPTGPDQLAGPEQAAA